MANQRRQFLRNTALATLGLGLTTSTKANNNSTLTTVGGCAPTTLDYYGEGPFYTDSPPLLEDNQLADANEPGERMVISGRVLNLACDEYLPDTVVDVWHANNNGQYDNQGFNLRGFVRSNDQGFYLFETIKPGKYGNGGTFRPSHIHFKIKPPGFPTLTTQLYFEGDTSIAGDAAASITSGTYDATNRIIPLTENAEGVLEGTFDIVIDGDGVPVGTQDLHLSTGMVYQLSPNPFTSELRIHYGIFSKARVGLVVYNLQGQQVAVLADEEKAPGKYDAYWRPDSLLPNGHYFVALKINDFQVHYQKIIKQ